MEKKSAEASSTKDFRPINLRRSRKAFLVEYLCGISLLVLTFALSLKGVHLLPAFRNLVLGIAIVAFIIPEISRAFLRYHIGTDKIIITHGFIKQKRKNIHYLPLGFVPDINLHQTRVQRLLNYGTVYVEGQGAEKSFEIRDVSRPKRVMETIEGLIDVNRLRLG